MRTESFESLILYVSDLGAARAFYVEALGLSVLFEDAIIVVVGGPSGRVVLHRDDRGHDERGIFPAGSGVGGAAIRFTVDDPDACERDAAARGLPVVGQLRMRSGGDSSSWRIRMGAPSCLQRWRQSRLRQVEPRTQDSICPRQMPIRDRPQRIERTPR
jgi:catechol 2,3-dioxygenase-like lactoylglutathione lyase family enzyme